MESVLKIDLLIILIFGINALNTEEKLYKSISMKEFFGCTILGIVLNIVISFTISLLPPNITSDYDVMMKQDRAESLYLIFFTCVIAAPMAEEIIFRRCICNWFYNEKVGIFASAFAFGLAHMNLIQSTYTFLSGLLFAYLYKKKNNLTIPTLIHIAINGTSFLFTYFIE